MVVLNVVKVVIIQENVHKVLTYFNNLNKSWNFKILLFLGGGGGGGDRRGGYGGDRDRRGGGGGFRGGDRNGGGGGGRSLECKYIFFQNI